MKTCPVNLQLMTAMWQDGFTARATYDRMRSNEPT